MLILRGSLYSSWVSSSGSQGKRRQVRGEEEFSADWRISSLDDLDEQEPSNRDVGGGDHLLFGDLSHMHRGRSVVDVNNYVATQHYSTCSAKVVWGLWVLGLHKERTILEPRTTCQAPYLLVKKTMTTGSNLQMIMCIYLFGYIDWNMVIWVTRCLKGWKGPSNG